MEIEWSGVIGEMTFLVNASRSKELVLILLVTLIGLGMALTWLESAARAWPVLQVERLLTREQPVAPERLAAILEKAWELNPRFLPGRQVHAPILIAAYLYSVRNPIDEEQSDLPAQGVHAARQALALEPANAQTWARLAFFEYVMSGPSATGSEALRLSVYTAPAKPNLLYWRLGLLARHQAFWDYQMVELIRSQILLAWRANPKLLVDTIQLHGLTAITRLILAPHPNQLRQLDSRLEQQAPKK